MQAARGRVNGERVESDGVIADLDGVVYDLKAAHCALADGPDGVWLEDAVFFVERAAPVVSRLAAWGPSDPASLYDPSELRVAFERCASMLAFMQGRDLVPARPAGPVEPDDPRPASPVLLLLPPSQAAGPSQAVLFASLLSADWAV